MAGGSGRYNRGLIEELARDAAAQAVVTDDPSGAENPGRPAPQPRTRAAPSRRHAWLLGPPEDPGPHPALLVSQWLRHGGADGGWQVQVVWYSEDSDAVVQQWVDAAALRPNPE